MAGFDPDGQFRQQAEAALAYKGRPSTSATAAESAEKVARLTQQSAEIEQRVKHNAGSLIGQWGLNPNSVAADAVNLGASFAAMGSQVLGDIAAAPVSWYADSQQAGITPEQQAAFQRYSADQENAGVEGYQNQATEEDMALLNSAAEIPDSSGTPSNFANDIGMNTYGSEEGTKTTGLFNAPSTVLERATRARDARDTSDWINEKTEGVRDWIHSGNRDALSASMEGGGEALSTVGSGFDAIMDGNILDGAKQMAAGLRDTAVISGRALSNPAGIAEYLAELGAQVGINRLPGGIVASTVGYSQDLIDKGVREYQKQNDGALPDKATRDEIEHNALVAGALNFAGDATIMKLLKKGKPVTGLGRSIGRTAKVGTAGAVSEGGTEGLQTYYEGLATLQPASMQQIFEGGFIGAAAGGGMTGASRAVQEIAQATPEHQEANEIVRTEAAKEAASDAELRAGIAETGEPGDIANPASDQFKPLQALAGLYEYAGAEGRTTEETSAAHAKMDKLVADTNEHVEELQDYLSLREESGQRIQQSAIDQSRKDGDEDLATLLEAEMAEANSLDDKAVARKKNELRKQQETLTKMVNARKRADDIIAPAEVVQEAVTPVLEASAQGDQDSTNRVLSMAIMQPDSLTSEQLDQFAGDTNNSLSTEQRDYIRKLSLSQQKQNELKSSSTVSQNIMEGGKGFLGLSQYRGRVSAALRTGRTAKAAKSIESLGRFADQHAGKAEAVEKAYNEIKGTKHSINLVYSQQKGWERVERPVTRAERKANAGIKVSSSTAGLMRNIRTEADAVRATYDELSSAIAMSGSMDTAAATEAAESVQAPQAEQATAEPTSAPVSTDPATAGTAETVVTEETGSTPVTEPASTTPEVTAEPVETAPEATQEPNESTTSETTPTPTEAAAEPVAQPEGEQQAEPVTNEDASLDALADQEAALQEEQDDSRAPEDLNQVTEQDRDAPQETAATETRETDDGSIESEPTPRVQAPESRMRKLLTNRDKYVRPSATEFQNLNLVEVYMSQGNANGRPLAEEGDFLQDMLNDLTVVNEYLEEDASGKQMDYLQYASRFANKLGGAFDAAMEPHNRTKKGKKSLNPKFYYTDMVEFLRDDTDAGAFDANVRSAMLLNSVDWLASQSVEPRLSTTENINLSIGRDAEAALTTEAYNKLAPVGPRERLIHNELGKAAVKSLGIKLKQGAPASVLTNLETSMGAHMMAGMVKAGLVTRTVLTHAEIQALIPKGAQKANLDGGDGQYITHAFVNVARTEDGSLHPAIDTLSEKSKGTSSVLSTVLGTDPRISQPSFAPVKLEQTTAKNSKMGIPSFLRKTLNKEGEKAHLMKHDMGLLLDTLSRETLENIAGVVDPESIRVHTANSLGLTGKNDALKRELDSLAEWKSIVEQQEKGLDTPFYLGRSVWKMQRVGLDSNLFDPLQSKVHRHAMYMDGWQSKINLNDPTSVDAFLLAVADALDISTDKQTNAASLGQLHALLDNPKEGTKGHEIVLGIEAIRQVLEGNAPTPEMEAAIALAVERGGMGMHTLDGLTEYANMLIAEDKGQASFTSTLMREVDGVTNGPILTQLMLGAATSKDSMAALMEKGGMFTANSTDTQYGAWRSREGNQDLYESLAQSIHDAMKHVLTNDELVPVMKSVEFFTGDLVSSSGKLNRNLVKKPLTALVFGAGMESSIADLGYGIEQSFYDKIQEIASENSTPETQQKMLKVVLENMNTLLGSEADHFNTNMPIQQALNTQMTTKQLLAMGNSFGASMGQGIEVAFEDHFSDFLKTRTALNSAAQTAFEVYKVAHDALHESARNQLKARGELPVDPKTGEPLVGLDADQIAAIDKQLQPLLPTIHTPMSRGSGSDPLTGIFLGKTDREISSDIVLSGLARVEGDNNLGTRGIANKLTNPGVSGLILGMHSTDSAISARAYALSNALNVHDAHGHGINGILQGARNLNRMTLDVMTNYSLPTEMADSLDRVLLAFPSVVGEYTSNNEANKALAKLNANMLKRMSRNKTALGRMEREGLNAIGYTALEAREAAVAADTMKLSTMLDMVAIDQYGMENGNHIIKDSERKRIQTRLDTIKQTPEEVLEAVRELGAAIPNGGKKSAATQRAAQRIQQEEQTTIEPEEKVEPSVTQVANYLRQWIETTGRVYYSRWTKGTLSEDSKEIYELHNAQGVLKDIADNRYQGYQKFPSRLDNSEAIRAGAVKSSDQPTVDWRSIDLGTLHGMILHMETSNRIPAGSWKAVSPVSYGTVEKFEAALPDLFPADVVATIKEGLGQLATTGYNFTFSISLQRNDPAFSEFLLKNDGQPLRKVVQQYIKMTGNKKYAGIAKVLLKTLPADSELQIDGHHKLGELGDGSVPHRASAAVLMRGGNGTNRSAYTLVMAGPGRSNMAMNEEVFIHELVHAATNSVLMYKDRIRKPDPAVLEIEAGLEALLEEVKEYVATLDHPARWDYATSNILEMISFAYSDPDFQKDVLAKVMINMENHPALYNGNKYVNAMQAFIGYVTKLLMGREAKRHENGLATIIAYVSGIQAANNDAGFGIDSPGYDTGGSKNMSLEYRPQDLFDALKDTSGANENTSHLQNLMTNLVENVHGPMGPLMEQAFDGSDPVDGFANALVNGDLPFASRVSDSGYALTDREAYVLENVHATVEAAIDSDSIAYRELSNLWNEAKERMPESTFHQGDWAKATDQEKALAKQRRDFLFKLGTSSNSRSSHLARFMATALVQPEVRRQMDFLTAKRAKSFSGMKLGEALVELFRRFTAMVHSMTMGIKDEQLGTQRLDLLAQRLTDVHAKNVRNVKAKDRDALDRLEEFGDTASAAVRQKVVDASRSKVIRSSKNAYVRGVTSIGAVVASQRTAEFADTVLKIRNKRHKDQLPGMAVSLFNEARGAHDNISVRMQTMFREVTKVNEHARMQAIQTTKKAVLESYANKGKDLNKEERQALTAVLLRTGMSDLLAGYDMKQITTFVNSSPATKAEIKKLEAKLLDGSEVSQYYVSAAKDLGYFLATGVAKGSNVVRNAHNIAHLHGVEDATAAERANADTALPTIDLLASLYALEYSPSIERGIAGQVMLQEQSRGNESGAEATLRIADWMQRESMATLFDGSPVHMAKGYTAEITDPNISMKVANETDGANLERMGWERYTDALVQDTADPDKTSRGMYIVRDGGTKSYLSGMVSMSSEQRQGSDMYGPVYSRAGAMPNQQNQAIHNRVRRQKRVETRAAFKRGPSYDPSKVKGTFAVPNLNTNGEVVGYRYMMSHAVRDTALRRENDIGAVMGAMAGSITDKPAAKEQNRQVMQALFDSYSAEVVTNGDAYVEVSANSTNPALREAWHLLPDDTKAVVREIWGGDRVMVRNDLADMTFGYRKASITNLVDKERAHGSTMRNVTADLFAYLANINKKHLTEAERDARTHRLANKLRSAEDMWMEVVKHVKDILVVKTGLTLLGNISSNVSLLLWYGVSPSEIGKYHKESIEGLINYRRDLAERDRLQLMLDSKFAQSMPEVEQRITELNDLLDRSKVKRMIDAGMLPTIVEDVDLQEDTFSYQSLAQEKLSKVTDRIPKPLRTGAKWLYMAHDTPIYKILSQGTQMSDFVARYTLFEHATKSGRKQLPDDKALQLASDMFINYDIPTHRNFNYANEVGLLMFTKYYVRIQKVIMTLYQDHPARALALSVLTGFLPAVPMLMDSAFWHRLYSPLRGGALELPEVVPELATLNGAMSFWPE